MPLKTYAENDIAIHQEAVGILFSNEANEWELRQGKFSYSVKGTKAGHLSYRRSPQSEWVRITNWIFFEIFLLIRYRKAKKLRLMYAFLFRHMNYRVESFGPYTITVMDNDSKLLRRGEFYLSPPGEFEAFFKQRFEYTDAELEALKRKIGW